MTGKEGTNPSAGSSIETFIESKVWLHKFNMMNQEHCAVLVIMKAPKELTIATFQPIDIEIYTVAKQAIERKYYSTATPTYMATKESNPENAVIVAKDAGITALAAEDTPKEIASVVQTAVISKVREVLPAPEDIVKTVRTIVTCTMQLPNKEWRNHSVEILKGNSTIQSIKLTGSLVEMVKSGKIPEKFEPTELPEERPESL